METLLGSLPSSCASVIEQLAAVDVELRAATFEEGSGGGFEQFDAQALGGDGDLDLAFDLVEVAHLVDGALQLVFQLWHVVFGEKEVLAGAGDVRSQLFGGAVGILEVAADGLLYLLAGVEQPEDDEQSHHGGDEIGVGDLPGATVMAAVAGFFLEDDDGASFIHGWVDGGYWGAAAAAASGAAAVSAARLRQADSTSLKEGRT